MVTHYRHNHITSWNKCWGYRGRHYRSGWFGDYEDEKSKVNERAKRQIIRKTKAYLMEHEIGLSTFEKLQWNSHETLTLAEKLQKEIISYYSQGCLINENVKVDLKNENIKIQIF